MNYTQYTLGDARHKTRIQCHQQYGLQANTLYSPYIGGKMPAGPLSASSTSDYIFCISYCGCYPIINGRPRNPFSLNPLSSTQVRLYIFWSSCALNEAQSVSENCDSIFRSLPYSYRVWELWTRSDCGMWSLVREELKFVALRQHITPILSDCCICHLSICSFDQYNTTHPYTKRATKIQWLQTRMMYR